MTGNNFVRMRIGFILFALYMSMTVITVPVYAEEEKEVFIEMNKTQLQMGVSTEIVLVLRNVGKAQIHSFEGMENFETISTGQSNSTQIINGATTKEVRVTYRVMPIATGTFTLKASIESGKDMLETKPLEITITERDASMDTITEEVYVRTVINDDEIYFGEKAVVTYQLFSQYNLENSGIIEDVTIDGLIVDKVDTSVYQPDYMTISGNQYMMVVSEQLIVEGIKPGTYEIPAFDFQANLSTGGFFNSSKPVYLETETASLRVKALPEEGRPYAFGGLTGTFDVEAVYSAQAVEAGDPVTLSVTVEGSGNLSVLDSISQYGMPEGFTVYETDKGLNTFKHSEGSKVSRSYELIMIPKDSGQVTVPDFEIPYFDTDRESYGNLRIPGTLLTVGEQTGSNESGSGIGGQGDQGMDALGISASPLLINQVSYAGSDDNHYVLKLSKTGLKNLLVALAVLTVVAVGLIVLYQSHKKHNDPRRQMRKEILRAESDVQLYEAVSNLVKYSYGIELKSTPISELAAIVDNSDAEAAVKQFVYYIEHQRHYSRERFDEIKALVADIITF